MADHSRRAYRRDMLLAGVMVAAGLVMSGVSLAELATTRHPQMAQATQPLQSTPGADTKPSAPAEPATTGPHRPRRPRRRSRNDNPTPTVVLRLGAMPPCHQL
jgi:hypothetical protein